MYGKRICVQLHKASTLEALTETVANRNKIWIQKFIERRAPKALQIAFL